MSLEGVDPEDVVGDAALSIFGERYPLALDKQGDKVSITGRIDIDDVPLWHPHTHGAPLLHEYSVDVEAGGEKWNVRSGKLGFRTVEVDRSDGKLAFTVNGTNFFARGACWTTNDIVALVGDAERLEHTLNLVRDSGANMIRVGGTMTYETDRFYELCDELGISVWQDFMFANMDYPSGDEAFLTDASSEIEEQLVRLREHPCVIVWCGGSEVEQQAAMFGMTEDVWRSELFYDVIPGAIDDLSPDTPYFPSSPCEGALPFHNSSGPAHYFGVGAYRQTLDDLHKSNVKFASECLAFSNVPSDRALKKHFGSTAPPPHHPDWKSGVPRDSAAGWDFEDIRDHYIEALYDVDPVKLRYADRDRYIGISQVVTGELMEHVYGYWRSDRSSCGGGLIWFLNDIVPGAGWGYIDSDAQAKPLFYFLRRCWDNITLSFVDRGLDGLDVQVINETGEDLVGTLDVFLLQHARIVIAEGSRSVDVDARGERAVSIDALLGRFFDTTYRYRFGPSKHDVVIASLTLDGDTNPRVACYFPNGHGIRRLERADISIRCEAAGEATKITLCADSYLQHVRLFAQNHDFDDNYFHLPPNTEYTIVATPISESNRPFRGVLSALNLASPVSFR